MRASLGLLGAVVGFVIAAASASAHHSFAAEYDSNQPVKVTGVVTRVDWTNPHIWFFLDVKDEQGKVTNWGFSGGPPGVLQRRGISKNVLKRGYIHPERPADPKKLIDLGVSDEEFLAAMNAALKRGGLMLVYNLFPAQAPSDKPYIPWADGRSPFSRAQWEAAGFEVIAFDVNDDAAIRALARALGWDQPVEGEPGMDLEHDLFALYSLFRKR